MSRTIPVFLESELRSSLDTRHHWSATSQTYAPAVVLMQYLTEGWSITPIVGLEEYWYGGGRHVTVYYLELVKGTQTMVMPVQGNPVVRRLLHQPFYQLVPINSFEITASENGKDWPSHKPERSPESTFRFPRKRRRDKYNFGRIGAECGYK